MPFAFVVPFQGDWAPRSRPTDPQQAPSPYTSPWHRPDCRHHQNCGRLPIISAQSHTHTHTHTPSLSMIESERSINDAIPRVSTIFRGASNKFNAIMQSPNYYSPSPARPPRPLAEAAARPARKSRPSAYTMRALEKSRGFGSHQRTPTPAPHMSSPSQIQEPIIGCQAFTSIWPQGAPESNTHALVASTWAGGRS